MNTRKFINKYGSIEEGQLLSNEEADILKDPLFDTVPFNVAVKGTYFNSDTIQSTLLYILKHFTLTRRNAPTSLAAASVVNADSICDLCGEVLDADGCHVVYGPCNIGSGKVDTNA
jgi:hypothetical protein